MWLITLLVGAKTVSLALGSDAAAMISGDAFTAVVKERSRGSVLATETMVVPLAVELVPCAWTWANMHPARHTAKIMQ